MRWRILPVLCVAALSISSNSKPRNAERRPLHQEDFKTIIDRYLFIDDFTIKSPEREISEEIFWKYALPLPKIDFPIYDQLDDDSAELPSTPGSGLEYFHINKGRVSFIKDNIEEAKNTWLSGRARFGDKWPYDRRQDYFLGLAFMRLGMDRMRKDRLPWRDGNVRGHLSNAATFLSWALLVKEAKDDPLFDQVSPKQFYNLAAIYYNYGRFGAAFGAAKKGVDYLRKTGRNEYRSELQQILAESFIQNRSYLEAVQVFDTALRHKATPKQASVIFARVADIYFDLNNYELAETNYALANRVDKEIDQIRPAQFVLRGEALFWLGKFSDAARMLHYGLEFAAANNATEPLPTAYAGFAQLRLADSYLAMGNRSQAKVEYARTSHEFSSIEPGKIARIRSACLEMPEYGPANEDRNVEHARNLLNASKDMDLPEPARELAWACNTLSYAERERTKEMVDRVREFYAKYPFSRRFLQKMIQPVIEVQASQLSDFIAKNDPYSATQFFETSRDILFKSMTDQLRKDLFIAYMDIYNAKAAKEFLDAYVRTEPQSMLKDIRLAAFYAETQDSKSGKVSKQQTEAARRLLASDMSQKRASLESLYLNRIKSTPAASLNLPWIYRLETAWAKDDEKLVCSHVFPTLARIFDEESSLWDASVRRQEVEAFVSKQLPEMFRKDEGCAISIMEFEYEVFKSRPLELAALYGERESWPMLEDIVSLFWSLAEQLKEIGEHEKARNIFQIIAEKGPQTSSKVRFAKLRLDKSKTEFEKLWE